MCVCVCVCVCLCVTVIKCNNNPLCQKFQGTAVWTRKKEWWWVYQQGKWSLRQSFIHHFYTSEDGHGREPDSLYTYAAQQSYQLSLCTYFSLLVRLYGVNKVSVTEVLEMSWFVFCIQTCDHFHHVIKITTQFCSPSKFPRWLPFVCCPQLHILLFPQYKPPIPIDQWLP